MLKKLPDSNYSIPTRLIYGKSLNEEWDYSHHVIPPMTASSTFRLDSTRRGAQGFESFGHLSGLESAPIYVYDRLGEPNNDMLQDALAVAEEADSAVTFASGMAAVHAAAGFSLEQGSEILAHHTLYGCTYSLFSLWFKRWGIPVRFVDFRDIEAVREGITEKTSLLYLESPANPTLDLIDLDAVAEIVREANAKREKRLLTVIDNTFATPYCQRPVTHGIDIVVHSLTKGIGGFGTDMGGAVIAPREYREMLMLFRKDFGGTLAPQTAWHHLVYGVSTLALRMPRQQQSALRVARFLEAHPAVERVAYPGLPSFPQYDLAQRMLRDYKNEFAPGMMIYFGLKGASPAESRERGEKMMNHIAQNAYTITLAVSLGQLRTLIEHPASMTHAAYPPEEQARRNIDPGGIRLAVGIEDPDDLIRDLDAALSGLT